MMRKISFIFTILVLTSSYSCNDDYLQIDNPNTYTTANFWKTETDVKQALVACYSTLMFEGIYRQWYMWMYELRSDLGWNNSAWGDFGLYTKFLITDYNFELNRYVWHHHFQAIFRCNQFLQNVPGIPFADEDLKNQYLAEVKFLRGMYYYNLTILYGYPPLNLEPSTGSEQPANATQEELWEQIEKDLSDSKSFLKWEYPLTDSLGGPGRITKGAAHAFLGKAYMQQHKWSEASMEFDSIIQHGMYSLVPEYLDNFQNENENNEESIFEIQFSDVSWGDWPDYNSPNAPLGNKWPQYVAPRDVGGHSDGQPGLWYVNEFTDLTQDGDPDPRAEWSAYHKITQYMYGERFIAFGGYTPLDTTGGKWPKIWYAKYSEGYYKDYIDYNSPLNLRVVRYSDILLLQAEALNQLDGPVAEVYQYIDMVRQRPSVNIVPLSEAKPGLSKGEMQEQIEHERVVELGAEGLRWQDLARWGYLDTEEGRQALVARDPEFKTYRSPYCKYLPIPQYDLDINKNLKQNEGW